MEKKIKSHGVTIELNIAATNEGCLFCEEFKGVDEFFYFVAENADRILKAIETEDIEIILKTPDGKIAARLFNSDFEVIIKKGEEV